MTTDTVGGVWVYAVDLVAGLLDLGAEVTLATMGGPLSKSQWEQMKPLRGVRVVESDYRLEWMHDPWADVARAGRWLQALERRLTPDVIHLNNYAHGALPWRVPVLMAGHSCVVSWWHAVHGTPPPAEYHRYRRVVRDGLHHADRVVAPSRAMRDALQRHYPPLSHAEVIHNGCDAGHFHPGDKQPLLLSAGRLWDKAKNIETAALAASSSPWPLHVAGEARHPDGGGATAFPGVHGIGNMPREQLRRWYARAAIYLHPARYEPFGLSVLEAACSGCALILGDTPSMRELWDDAALFVDPDDEAALAAAIQRLVQDEGLRRRLADAARPRARRYTLDSTVKRYAELYRSMLHLPAGGAGARRHPRQADFDTRPT